MNEQRLVDIEIRLEYQEQTIDALNDVIVELRENLEKARKEIERLRSKIEDEQPQFGPADEKPPHY